MTSAISSSVRPLVRAILKWMPSSLVARSAMSMPSVTRLRSRRLRPSRPHSRPKTLSTEISNSSSPNPPLWRVDLAVGQQARQQLAEDVQSCFAHISHGSTLAVTPGHVTHWAGCDADGQGSGVRADVDGVAGAGQPHEDPIESGMDGHLGLGPSVSDIVIEPSLLAR